MKMQKVIITAKKVGSVATFTICRENIKPAFVAISTNSNLSFNNFSGAGHNTKGSFQHEHFSEEPLDDFIKAVFQG